MKKLFAVVFVLLSMAVHAQSPSQGIGLRLGDPLGITYKKYLHGNQAMELIIGTAGNDWHRTYYSRSFDKADKYRGFNYRTHSVQSSLYLQGRFLLDNPIYVDGMEGKWDWYWGVGGVLKIAKIRYHADSPEPPFEDYHTFTDIDLGPEGIIGMEYTFEGAPVSVFGELSLMLEIVNRITLQPFAGVGVRYNF